MTGNFITNFGSNSPTIIFSYRAVEKEVAEHFNACTNPALPFPMPAAVAGGSHLYEMYHFDKPWKWTG